MPKEKTKAMQEQLMEFGNLLGFDAAIEDSYPHELFRDEAQKPGYKPKGDVVWYWNLESEGINLKPIKNLLEKRKADLLDRIPFARFETEGSTPSSKYQIGNLDNLRSGDAIFKVLITNNEEATTEKDTYRRMVKVVSYYQTFFGNKNIIFADWEHIQQSMKEYEKDSNKYIRNVIYEPFINSKGRGVDNKLHKKVKDHLTEAMVKSGLEVVDSYEPSYAHDSHMMIKHIFGKTAQSEEELAYLKLGYYHYPTSLSIDTKNSERYTYYVPQVDLAALKEMPEGAVKWLAELGKSLRAESVNNCLLYCLSRGMIDPPKVPILTIEVEVGNTEAMQREGSKHLLGGCTNASANGYIGVLASYSNNKKYVDYVVRELGHRNLSFFSIDPLLF